MTKRYWISGTLGDWSTGSIWVLGAIPRPMDDPVINTLSSVTVSGITAAHSVTMNTAPIFEASNAQSSSMVEPTPVSPAAIDPVTPASAPVVDHFLLWGTDSELVGYFSPASDNVSVAMNPIAAVLNPLSDTGLLSDDMTTMDRPTLMALDDTNVALHRTGDDSQASGTVEANGSGIWSYTPTGLSDETASTPTNVSSNTAPQPASLSWTVVTSPPAATESIAVGTGSSVEQSAGNSSSTGLNNQNAMLNFMADGSQSSGPHSATTPTSLLSFVGFDYFAANTNSYLIPSSQVAITTLANMGTNTIALNFNLYEQTTTSNVVTNDSQYGGSSAGLSAAVEYAHSLGLKVAFSPNILALTGYADPTNLWQGYIQPTDPAAWFASYTQVLVQYATLAQNDHVDLFVIGSELSWLDSQPQFLPYWTELISAVRSVYTGPITYGASFIGDWEPQPWISTPNYPESVTFWNQLNYLGVDLNPNLTTNPDDNAAAFANAWYSDATGHNIIAYLESLSSTFGKDILITALGGFSSYLGSNENTTDSTPQNAVPDNLQQELLYNSAYAALTQANTGWLSGILQWQEDPYPANGLNGIETANNTPTGDGVFGKPAQYLLAAWYGAKDYLSWSDTSFVGSILNDQICLYGNQYVPTQANPNPTTKSQTFATTISVTFGGNILNGHVATLELSANGNDLGSFTLNSADVGNYVDQNGVSSTNDETFIATIPGLTNISQLKVSFVSPVDLGSVETSNAFISNLSINGISLSGVTYVASDGTTSQELIDGHNSDGNSSFSSGGYMLVDPIPWNLQVTNNEAGTITQPIQVDGGGGIDTVYVLGVPADYQINEVNANTVTLTENSGWTKMRS